VGTENRIAPSCRCIGPFVIGRVAATSVGPKTGFPDPGLHRLPGSRRDLELDRPLRLLLQDGRVHLRFGVVRYRAPPTAGSDRPGAILRTHLQKQLLSTMVVGAPPLLVRMPV